MAKTRIHTVTETRYWAACEDCGWRTVDLVGAYERDGSHRFAQEHTAELARNHRALGCPPEHYHTRRGEGKPGGWVSVRCYGYHCRKPHREKQQPVGVQHA